MSNPYEGDPRSPSCPLNLKPYNFEIKDYEQMKNLLHCNTPIGEPVIKCPDFHVQLDHTLAVLWLFYDDYKNWNKLTTSHLEWAIRFIDGVLSLATNGEYSEVETAKKNLEELLIVYYAEVDVNTFRGETGRITAMPVIEQKKMDPNKILENFSFPPAAVAASPVQHKKPHVNDDGENDDDDDDEDMIKQLSYELAFIQFSRAQVREELQSAGKVNRLYEDIKSQAADIKQLTDHLLMIRNTSNFIFINNLN